MSEQTGTPKTSRPRRWWRWLWRLVLAGCLLLAALLAWAWHERVFLVNAALGRVGGDTQVQVSGLEWDNGLLRITEVSAQHLPTGQRVGQAGRVEWRPDWAQLWNKNLGSVKVEGGSMDAALALFATQGGEDAAPGKAGQLWRLEMLDLASTKIVLRDEKRQPLLSVTVQGSLRGGTSAISFESTSVDGADLAWQGRTISSRFHMDAAMVGDRIQIKQARLEDGQFDLAWVKGFYPLLEGGVEVEWEGEGMVLGKDAGLIEAGSHRLRLKNLHLRPTQGPGEIKAQEFSLSLSQGTDGVWHVADGRLLQPVVSWTQEVENMLFPQRTPATPAVPGAAAATPKPWQAAVDELQVSKGRVTLAATQKNPVAGSLGWSSDLKAVQISPAGIRSAAAQQVRLADLSLRWDAGRQPAEGPAAPFVSAANLVASIIPDRFQQSWATESLRIQKLSLEFTPENGPWFAGPQIPAPPEAVEDSDAAKPVPFWQKLTFGTLEVTEGVANFAFLLRERLEANTRFEIHTQQQEQHLRLSGVQAYIPARSTLAVTGLEKVEAVASLPALWSSHRLKSLSLEGGYVDVGDALMSLFSGQQSVVAEDTAEQVEKAAARWVADEVRVANLGVTVMHIAPGLPPVRFEVNFSAGDTPLDLDGLALNVEPQRIVLNNLRIPSPHEPLRTVAEMDVIHVNYTLDGLLHRRIDRVDIIAPLLYVGEDLFWYVENYRKFVNGEPELPDPGAGPPAPVQPAPPGWRVDTLAVTDGRLLLAPKGVPLAGFSRPFPFSFTSKLESGQLDAVFDIPTDDYTLKDLKLEFRQMKGQVRFNLPMKDRNNNLTETFTVEQLRWKELHMEKAHLSVTYDANGIYGQFGGQAYGGYVNGAFDVYLDEVYTWDGWISGAGISLGPITQALSPGYLLLSGDAEAKVVATGNMHELYQGDLEFGNRTQGKFSIEALNDIIKDLPPVLQGDISQQIRRIGLETLREFAYDRMEAKARFYGREGQGYLRFTGPKGGRRIDVNVYDHRWKEEPRKSATARAEEP